MADATLPSHEPTPRHAVRMPITDADRARFAKKTEPGVVPDHRPDLGPCLIWTGSKKTAWGYGQFQWGGFKGPNRSAHAFAWESVHGPIPPGLTVDHLCRVTSCVQVTHMEVVTRAENFRRANEARTDCKKGHGPLVRGASGKRRCPVCVRQEHEQSQARRRRLANGLPDRRRRYDPEAIRRAAAAVAAGSTITAAAAEVGCSDQYLGKVVKRARASA